MDAARKLIQERVLEVGTDLKAASLAIGRNHAYLQQFISRGVPAELSERDRKKLAALLKIEEDRLRSRPIEHIDSMDVAALSGRIRKRRPDQEVRVVGYIGAGAEVHAIDDHEKGAGLDVVQVDFPVRHGTVGVIVRGDSMLPMFEDGDLVGYLRDAAGPEQLIGKICVVKVQDGPTYIKRLKRGSEPGLYTLVSANARDIEDVEVEWAARYRFHLPADEWHRLKNGS